MIIAHRGASKYAPENTKSAFEKAIELKADGIETDVQLSKDGVLVIIHDYKVNRTSNESGKVNNYNLSELKKFDFGCWFSDETRNKKGIEKLKIRILNFLKRKKNSYHFKHERIMTLEEFCSLIPNDIFVNIEIKHSETHEPTNERTELVVSQIIDIVSRYNLHERCIISSFNHNILKRIKNQDCNIKIGLLFRSNATNIEMHVDNCEIDIYSIHINYQHANCELVKYANDNNIEIFAYTVNSKKTIDKLLEIGVSNFITDIPDIMRK